MLLFSETEDSYHIEETGKILIWYYSVLINVFL